MECEIDFRARPLSAALDVLLRDRATGGNILWAADPPSELPGLTGRDPIAAAHLARVGGVLRAPEAGPPAWRCYRINNELDERWFGRASCAIARVEGRSWTVDPQPMRFPKGKRWQAYVDSRRLAPRCGEALLLCCRWDAATGEALPVERRAGMLDRKLRVVSENAAGEAEWRRWALRALQSVYGYEYRGDRLLLARANLLLSYAEYRERRWHHPAEVSELREAAEIISWNLWQMDDSAQAAPLGAPRTDAEQLDMFALLGLPRARSSIPCVVKNWRESRTERFSQLGKGRYPMKFDFVIGDSPK